MTLKQTVRCCFKNLCLSQFSSSLLFFISASEHRPSPHPRNLKPIPDAAKRLGELLYTMDGRQVSLQITEDNIDHLVAFIQASPTKENPQGQEATRPNISLQPPSGLSPRTPTPHPSEPTPLFRALSPIAGSAASSIQGSPETPCRTPFTLPNDSKDAKRLLDVLNHADSTYSSEELSFSSPGDSVESNFNLSGNGRLPEGKDFEEEERVAYIGRSRSSSVMSQRPLTGRESALGNRGDDDRPDDSDEEELDDCEFDPEEIIQYRKGQRLGKGAFGEVSGLFPEWDHITISSTTVTSFFSDVPFVTFFSHFFRSFLCPILLPLAQSPPSSLSLSLSLSLFPGFHGFDEKR